MANETEEKPPKFGEKAKRYAAGTFGLICLLFIIAIIAEQLSKQSNETVSQPAASVDSTEPTDVTSQTFQKVKDEREKADESVVVTQINSSSKGDLATFTDNFKPDLLQQEQQSLEALEFKRATLAARSSWGLISPQAAVPKNTQSTPVVRDNKPDHMLSSDEQRQMIAKRLQEVAILKQQIKAGNYSAFEAEEKSQTLTTLENSFSPPPP